MDEHSDVTGHSLMKRPSIINRWSVLVVLAVVVALGGYLIVRHSHAASGDVVVPPSTASVPVPTHGVYWGGTNNQAFDTNNTVPGCPTGGDGFANLECKIGWAGSQQGFDVSSATYHSSAQHFYTHCDDNDSAYTQGGAIWNSAHVSGRKMIQIIMKCGSWPTLGNGGGNTNQDTNIKHKVDLLTKVGTPILLSFEGEPENNACSNGGGQTPNDYRAASRQFTADVRNEENKVGIHNMSIAWITMSSYSNNKLFTNCTEAEQTGANQLRTATNWYPGDDAVDWIVPDLYVRGTDFASSVDKFYAWASSCPTIHPTSNYNCTAATHLNKPLGISETGITTSLSIAQRVAIIDELRTSFVSQYPRLKEYAYWSSGVSGGDSYMIDYPNSDASHTVLKAFARAELDPSIHNLVLGSATPTPTSTPTITPTPTKSTTPTPSATPTTTPTATPGGDTTVPTVSLTAPTSGSVSGSITVTGTASDNVGVVKVNLAVDGKYYDNDTAPPYASIAWNTTSVADGAHTLTLHAFDAAGNEGNSQTVTVQVRNTSTPTPLVGDVNGDGHINITDLSILNSHWGTSYTAADFNHDGTINITDLSILLSHWTG